MSSEDDSYNHGHWIFQGDFTQASKEKGTSPLKGTAFPGEMYRNHKETYFMVLATGIAHFKMDTDSVSTFDVFCLLLEGGEEVYDDVDASDYPGPSAEMR